MKRITIFDNDQVHQEWAHLEKAFTDCHSETLRHKIRLVYAQILKSTKDYPKTKIEWVFHDDYETALELFKFFADHADLFSSNVTLLFPNVDDAEQESYLSTKLRSNTF